MRRVDAFGLLCAGLALLLWALALPLGCAGQAALIGGVSLGSGALLGLMLALITRTLRPAVIYLCLCVAVAACVPLLREWPPGDMRDVRLAPGMPGFLAYYLDLLRVALFVLGIPYPFARLGHHAPDPVARREDR
ncbi:MAG: hypothetical protein RMJ43_11625 [Chloroherpetonaceae bacterium]|nr:hypothetical protein [Chthonomonadaceae bacterium]MDW8208479.1 hypothetical protein [Chloroherpetonaceae bacterium]